jgi:chaperonin GroEL (HSP60 family)
MHSLMRLNLYQRPSLKMQGNSDAGPDIENGGACSMKEADVWEPLDLVKQAVQSASEVTISILRIDDIIGKRGE